MLVGPTGLCRLPAAVAGGLAPSRSARRSGRVPCRPRFTSRANSPCPTLNSGAEPAEELPAERGAGGGTWLWQLVDPPATGRQAFIDWLSLTAFTAELFVAAFQEWVASLRYTVLVLNNASIHKAHLVSQHMAGWAARGLALRFLPPYSLFLRAQSPQNPVALLPTILYWLTLAT